MLVSFVVSFNDFSTVLKNDICASSIEGSFFWFHFSRPVVSDVLRTFPLNDFVCGVSMYFRLPVTFVFDGPASISVVGDVSDGDV